MNQAATASALAALQGLDACTLANTIESFGVRLRNDGFTDGSVRCLFPHLRPVVGYAATIKIRGANPPMGAGSYVDRTDWWDYVLTLPAPRILVIEDVSAKPGSGALLGAVHTSILQLLGCVGAVTNGAVRDVPEVENAGFALFAGNLAVSHSYLHVIEPGAPTVIAGLTIRSGDLLHGDRHGIQTVPGELLTQIPTAAARITARDRALIALCHAPGTTLTQVRAALNPAP